ncbi:hypothetical protein ACJZ2D_015957 [Fusarium nematophilum]
MAHPPATASTVDTAEMTLTAKNPEEESINRNTIEATGGDGLENGTISAFGYVPAYRRVLGSVVGVCVVIALSSPLGAIMIVGSYQISFAGYWGLSWYPETKLK